MSASAYYTRRFLNLDHRGGTAFIEAQVQELAYGTGVHAYFKIGDCNRTVSLDFDTNPDDDNALHKLRTLRTALAAFEADLVEQLDIARRRQEREELEQAAKRALGKPPELGMAYGVTAADSAPAPEQIGRPLRRPRRRPRP